MIKKTLLITLEYPPMIGGVAHYYKNLVGEFAEGQIVVLDNSTHQLLSTNRFLWPKWLKALWVTYRTIRRERIEHILVGHILPLGTVALILSWFLGKPYTVMTHAMDVTIPFGPEGSKHKQRLMRLILQSAHTVTTVSTYTKMQLESLFDVDPRKIRLLYPCPHYNGFRYSEDQCAAMSAELDERYQLHDKQVIVSIGRLVERKGVDYVIASMKLVKKQLPDARYIIVGDGPYRGMLEELVQKNDVADIVLFVGRATDADIAAWYARCDVFVMPSRELPSRDVEGFGIVFVEAASFGKPVIGGKSGGVLDAVLDGENGYVVNPMDIDMIQQAIVSILTDPVLAVSFGEEGRRRVKQYFEWSIQAKKLEGILTE